MRDGSDTERVVADTQAVHTVVYGGNVHKAIECCTLGHVSAQVLCIAPV